jgi:hypothetical protein
MKTRFPTIQIGNFEPTESDLGAEFFNCVVCVELKREIDTDDHPTISFISARQPCLNATHKQYPVSDDIGEEQVLPSQGGRRGYVVPVLSYSIFAQ